MSETRHVLVEVGGGLLSEFASAVDRGEFATVEAAIQDALEAWSAHRRAEAMDDETLLKLGQVGIDSGSGMTARKVFEALSAKYR